MLRKIWILNLFAAVLMAAAVCRNAYYHRWGWLIVDFPLAVWNWHLFKEMYKLNKNRK